VDTRRFDAFTRTLTTSDSPRRAILQGLGASALAAVVGRFAGEDAEAKKKGKKKKKCKKGTTKCGKKACCRADETCVNGKCVDDVEDPECVNDDQCAANEVCQNGVCVDDGNPGECQDAGDCAANESCIDEVCVCDFPDKPCGNACCASDQACVDGVCVVGQGTCNAGEDICAGDEVACNGNASCTCGIRFADGEPRCIQFVDDGEDNCTCAADFRCEDDFGPGTICIRGGENCPTCDTDTLGRCARLCPTQVGN
jgi:hypothetical protein